MIVWRREVVISVLSLLSFSVLAQTENLVEADCLSVIFKNQVSDLVPDQDYIDWMAGDALIKILTTENNYAPQYFVYVDRNPDKQNIMVGFFEPTEEKISIIGWDKVSTGNNKRKGHFITPIGIFTNSIANVGYRALGTKNSNGWRGLGKKDSRVWDFGWQKTEHQNEERDIRLLLHATDPDGGEKRLGQVDSKGCVRITAKLNYFLDHYSLLDEEYELYVADGRFSWLLAKDRETIKNPGKLMLVGDSANQADDTNLTLTSTR